jgi:hypothetical protein
MVGIKGRNIPRKTCYFAIFCALSSTMPYLGLNLSLRERLMDNHLNSSAVAMRIFFSIVGRKSPITKIPTGPKEKKENYIES